MELALFPAVIAVVPMAGLSGEASATQLQSKPDYLKINNTEEATLSAARQAEPQRPLG